MGPRYAPLYWLAGLISAKVNYHQPSFSYIFLPGNSLGFGTYTILSIVLRRVFKLDLATAIDPRRNGIVIRGSVAEWHRGSSGYAYAYS